MSQIISRLSFSYFMQIFSILPRCKFKHVTHLYWGIFEITKFYFMQNNLYTVSGGEIGEIIFSCQKKAVLYTFVNTSEMRYRLVVLHFQEKFHNVRNFSKHGFQCAKQFFLVKVSEETEYFLTPSLFCWNLRGQQRGVPRNNDAFKPTCDLKFLSQRNYLQKNRQC